MKIFFALLYLFSLPMLALADTYPEVIFDNSLVKGSYAKSVVSYEGKSWVENVNRSLLVSDTLYFTPGNALSLKYISQDSGSWHTDIKYSRQKFHYKFKNSDFLSFRIYVKSLETATYDLPRIYMDQRDQHSDTLDMADYIIDFERGKWVQVKIPCKVFNLSEENFINAVGFSQNGTSAKVHHLFIDQIEFLPNRYSEAKLSTAAILSEVKSLDKVVQLKWQLPLTPSIRYIKIYRSENGEDFKPVGLRPIYMQSSFDHIPVVGIKYYYRIAWVDYNYNESLPSAIKEVTTVKFADEKIIDLVQQAHVNYFVENFDVNSGMYLPYRSKEKAIVSTKETSGAILALIVGSERKYITRQTAFNRISKIVFFLMKAQNKNGIFPLYFDGRNGVPEYIRGTASYDVVATTSIIESLLIARTYFTKDTEEEKDLRNRITNLYQQINWRSLLDESKGKLLLKKRFSLMGDEQSAHAETLSGANESINSYLMAIASDKFDIDSSTYYNGIYYKYDVKAQDIMEELNTDIYTDSLIAVESIPPGVKGNSNDTYTSTSLINPIDKYAVHLSMGEYSASLMELYRPFLTIRPTLIQDSIFNWNDVLNNYTTYVKRRDNEFGVGSSSSDIWGFYQHKDSVGNYRINPAMGPSSILVNAGLGKASILALYKNYGHILFTEYGFRAWLDLRNDDVSDEYLASNQAAVVVLLENYKTGLIWKLYEQIPELKRGRAKLFADKAK